MPLVYIGMPTGADFTYFSPDHLNIRSATEVSSKPQNYYVGKGTAVITCPIPGVVTACTSADLCNAIKLGQAVSHTIAANMQYVSKYTCRLTVHQTYVRLLTCAMPSNLERR